MGLVWMRRIFLQMLAVRINAHLDLVSSADYFTPIAKLEQVNRSLGAVRGGA